jgi:hypothetical protein
MFVVRLLQPLFRAARKSLFGKRGEKAAEPRARAKPDEVDYSKYTRYKIEDAEYEEVSREKD